MTTHQPILAIDPGTEQSAFVLWDGKQIGAYGKKPNEDLFSVIFYAPGTLAIEFMQSFGMPIGKEVFETIFWIGRFWEHHTERFGDRHKRIRVYRSDVKLHHCGSSRAKDSNIRQALIDKYGKPGKKSSPGITHGLAGDMWSAFAIATYVSETQKGTACSAM